MNKSIITLAIMIAVSGCGRHTLHEKHNKRGHEYHNSQVSVGSQDELEGKIGDRIFFEYNSSELTFEARDILERQVAWMRSNPSATITIEGHTDERGERQYNLALGDRRATAVKSYIVSKGISSNRVHTISYGKEKPAVLGTGEEIWSQNRRAVNIVNHN